MITDKNNYDSPWFPKDKIDWGNLFNDCPQKSIKKDTVILYQDSPVNEVFYIKEGRVKFSILNDSGEEKTIYVLNAGNIFGDVAVANNNPYYLNATTVADCVILCIDSVKFMQHIFNDKNLAKTWISTLTYTIEYMINHIKDITFLDNLKLISKYIIKLCVNYGVETPNGIKLNIRFTHQEMAELVGSSRVTVSKVMNFFIKQKIIKKMDSNIYIIDIEKLRNFAH